MSTLQAWEVGLSSHKIPSLEVHSANLNRVALKAIDQAKKQHISLENYFDGCKTTINFQIKPNSAGRWVGNSIADVLNLLCGCL